MHRCGSDVALTLLLRIMPFTVTTCGATQYMVCSSDGDSMGTFSVLVLEGLTRRTVRLAQSSERAAEAVGVGFLQSAIMLNRTHWHIGMTSPSVVRLGLGLGLGLGMTSPSVIVDSDHVGLPAVVNHLMGVRRRLQPCHVGQEESDSLHSPTINQSINQLIN